jgi:uncharacterized protein YkwD
LFAILNITLEAQFMKIVQHFISLIFFTFSLFSVLPAAAGNIPLFIETDAPLPAGIKSVNPDIVLRQRAVFINFEMLAVEDFNQLTLNFFEDIQLTAELQQLEDYAPDGTIWMGTVDAGSRGGATFAFSDDRLTGTVRFDSYAYQVRHVEGPWHLVREIQVLQTAFNAVEGQGGPSSKEMEVLALVNLERQINNLHPLQWDSRLYASALGHSQDMAQQNYFSHTSLDGRSVGTRISQAGYTWHTYGENIAAGYTTPEAVVEGWMNSSGHRANILRSSFCDIGVGYAYASSSSYRRYWTQNFGRQKGVSACSAVQEYSISAMAGPHGQISPAGTVSVASGGSQHFTITADPGYQVADVIVDGQSVGARDHHLFSNVTAAHTIQVSFAKSNDSRLDVPWIHLLLLEE